MKKKAKLFTTIASLCMAVALMAFGVYAAVHQDLGVTSQVSFKTTSVYVDIAANVKDGAEHTVEYAGFTHDSSDPNHTPTAWNITDADPATEGNQDLAFTETDTTIEYTYTIKNFTDAKVYVNTKGLAATYDFGGTGYVTVTATKQVTGTDDVAADVNYATDTFQVELPAASDSTTPSVTTIVITLTLNNYNKSFEGQAVNYTMEIDREAGLTTRS